VLVLVNWRGEPGGEHDEPQHELMGQIAPGLFDLMGIRWEFFPQREDAIGPALDRAVRHMDTTQQPFGLIMKKDSVAPHSLKSKPQPFPLAPTTVYPSTWPAEFPTRSDVLRVVRTSAQPTEAIIATTGCTERVRQAMVREDLCHREPEFAALQATIRERLVRAYPDAERDFTAILLARSVTSSAC
jgi:phosphonopyruvate decarboxylase